MWYMAPQIQKLCTFSYAARMHARIIVIVVVVIVIVENTQQPQKHKHITHSNALRGL